MPPVDIALAVLVLVLCVIRLWVIWWDSACTGCGNPHSDCTCTTH